MEVLLCTCAVYAIKDSGAVDKELIRPIQGLCYPTFCNSIDLLSYLFPFTLQWDKTKQKIKNCWKDTKGTHSQKGHTESFQEL